MSYKVTNTLINTKTGKIVDTWSNTQTLALLNYLLDDRELYVQGNDKVFSFDASQLVQDEHGVVYTDTNLEYSELKEGQLRLADPDNADDDNEFINPDVYTVHTEIVRATITPRYNAGLKKETDTELSVAETN